jgi:hypothetical protein
MKTKAFDQEFGRIPNMAFFKVVRHFAFYKGLPMLTWKEQHMAFQIYIDIARQAN